MSDDLLVKLGIDVSGYTSGLDVVKSANNDLFKDMGRLANDASGYIRRVYGVMDRLDLSTIAVSESTDRARQAQDAFNKAVLDFGPGSDQAIKAQHALDQAHQDVERAQHRQHESQVLVVADLATMAGRLPRTIADLQALGASARAAAEGMTAAELAGAALTATVAGAAAVFVGMAVMDGYTQQAQAGATATDELAAAQANLAEQAKRVDPFGGGGFSRWIDSLPIASTVTGDYARALDRVQKAQAAVDAEHAQSLVAFSQNSVAEAAKKASDLAKELNDARGELQGFGLDAAKLGPSLLAGLAGVNPAFGELAKQIGAAHASELDLAKHILATGNPALISQMRITKDKSDSTDSLASALGITVEQEKALEDQGIITTGVLANQASVTSQTASASAGFGGASLSGGTMSPGVHGFTFTPGGPRPPTLQEFIQANLTEVEEKYWGVNYIPRGGFGPFDVAGVASHLQSGASGLGIPGVGGWVGGGAGSENYRRMVDTLKRLITTKLPSNQWDSLLGSLGVNGYAHGVEGIISKPGLFYAGERGPESISIRPVSQPSTGTSGGLSIGTVIVQANDRRGGEEAADALMRKLHRLGVDALS